MSKVLDFICSNETAFKSKARLTSLYSDFSLTKSTNPDGYAANVKSWTSALQQAAKEGVLADAQCADGLLSLNVGSSLEDELYLNGIGKPASLSSVLAENISHHTWIPSEEFRSSTSTVLRQNNRGGFHIPSPLEIAQWGLRQIGFENLTRKSVLSGQYVLIPNAELAAQNLRKYLSSEPPSTATSKIHSLETFTTLFSSILSPSSHPSAHKLSQSDMKVLLRYLSRDRSMLAVSSLDDEDEPVTIKLPSTVQTQPDQISQNDTRIAQLKTLIEGIGNQIDDLESRVEKLNQAARTAISSSSSKASTSLTPQEKSRALTSLRQKRLASATLEKRQASLDQIQDILQKIDDASSQLEIVSALENGATVLKELNKQVGGVERVDDVMDKLQEEMANVEEVGAVIAEGGQGKIDEGEIEDELEALEAEERGRDSGNLESQTSESTELLAGKLPTVPTTEPRVEAGPAESKNADVEETKKELVEKRLSQLSLDEDKSKTNATATSKFGKGAGEEPIIE